MHTRDVYLSLCVLVFGVSFACAQNASPKPRAAHAAGVHAHAVNRNQRPSGMAKFDANNCDALLKDGVFDQHEIFGSSFETEVFLNRFCSQHYNSFQQASSDSLNLGVPLGDFFASLGFNDAEQNFSVDYQTVCSQQDSLAQSDRISRETIRVADSNLANAFTACINEAIFVAYLEPTSSTEFQIFAKFRPPQSGARARVQSLNFSPPNAGSCDQPPREIGPQGTTINCSRDDASKAVQISLNTTGGTQGFRVPAASSSPETPGFGIGDVVMSMLPPNAFAAQHPRQEWVLCGSGTAPSAGSAWNRVTNNAPLPDCGNRYPRAFKDGDTGPTGAVLDAQVGGHTHAIKGVQLVEAQQGHGMTSSAFRSNSDQDHPDQNSFRADLATEKNTADGTGENRPRTVVFNFYIRVN
jgi:hypothetical protein